MINIAKSAPAPCAIFLVPEFRKFEIFVESFAADDCEFQTHQIVTILKRTTTVEFTNISAIIFIHC